MSLFQIIIILFFIPILIQADEPDILWEFDIMDMSFGNACAGDIDGDGKPEIVFSTYFNDGHIYALNSEDGSLLWKYDVKGCSDAAPLLIDINNDDVPEVILHSSSVTSMFCFNGSDGELIWKINSRATDSPPSGKDIDDDGIPEIFDGDFGGYVARYDARNGDKKWETRIERGRVVQTAPVIEDINGDGDYDLAVATYSFDSTCIIAALRADNGEFLWKSSEVTEAIYHGPAVADVDNDGVNEVIVSDYGACIFCLNGKDGSTKWKYKFPGTYYSGTPVTIADIDNDGKYDIIYFADNKLIVLDGDGNLKWLHEMIGGNYSFRGAVAADINSDLYPDIIFGDNNGGLTALSGNNGDLIWYYDFQKIYDSRFDLLHGPVVSDFNADGKLEIFFVGGWAEYPDIENNYGRAYMINAGTGNGPDWTMFRRDAARNAVLPIMATSVGEDYSGDIDARIVENALRVKLKNADLNYTGIELFDICGKKILSERISHPNPLIKSIKCGNLPAGVYFLSLSSGIKIIRKPIMKF